MDNTVIDSSLRTVEWKGNKVVMIDQTKLPNQLVFVTFDDYNQVADAITVPSREMYDEYTKKGYKVFHIPNAVDISSFPEKEDRRYDKQIIYAGRLSEENAIILLPIL